MTTVPCNTKIHKAGLAGEASELLCLHWSCGRVARYLALRYPEQAAGISEDNVETFKRGYVRTEDIMPRAAVRAQLEERSALVDVVSERAELIALQKDRIRLMIANEKTMSAIMGMTGKSQVGREMGLLNDLLDAHKRDLHDLGILRQATSAPPPGVNVSLTQNVVSVLKIEQTLIERGMDAGEARDTILRAAYGPERLGEGKPVSLCAPALDDQGAAVVVRGASVPEAAVRLGGSGDSHQEGSADGDQ
ncbi:MAG: hypothetical protein V1694_13475 [Candidatus Eisenbacteria bacterium]